MATAADLATYMDAAITAIGTSDWSTAQTKLLQAKAVLAGLPDSEKNRSSVTWDREAIDDLIDHVQNQANAATLAANGLSMSKMTRKAVSD